MNLARKARRAAQRQNTAQHKGAAQPFLQGDPPQADLARVLHTYRTRPHGEALALVTGLMARWPQSPALLGCAGSLCLQMEDPAAAIPMLEQAAALAPDNSNHANNLGVALKKLGRLGEAEAAFQRSIALAPDDTEAMYNLGNLYLEGRQFRAAMVQFLRVLDIDPDHAQALNNVGTALINTNHARAAADAFACAIKARPDFHMALANHAQALALIDDPLGAIARAQEALAIAPHYIAERLMCFQQAQVCDWQAHARFAALPVLSPAGAPPAPPFSALPFEDDPARHLARSRAFAAAEFLPARTLPEPTPAPDGRLRIGYLSCDFHDHATMYLLAGVLREHDRSCFAIHAFSYGPDDDGAMRAAARAGVEHFHDIAELTDDQAIALIRSCQIDVLVDLKGFTQGTRSALLGARLAPVQAAWLGYPGSLGDNRAVDYAIADHVVLPTALRPYFDEKVVWLAGSYQANDDQRPIVPDTQGRAAHGLPEEGFVFCSFNSIYKIGPAEFDVWMRLLGAVEGSVLWLLAAHPAAEANLRREAAARGIDPTRLVFAEKMEHHAHLGRLAHADLFLDSFTVNAHTTCSDALWAGLPVLTMAGRSFAARVGASLLMAAGLPELVTTSTDEYEARALEIAQNPPRLAALRTRLQGREHNSLFATAPFTRKLESAYCAMHARHIAHLPPADIDLARD